MRSTRCACAKSASSQTAFVADHIDRDDARCEVLAFGCYPVSNLGMRSSFRWGKRDLNTFLTSAVRWIRRPAGTRSTLPGWMAAVRWLARPKQGKTLILWHRNVRQRRQASAADEAWFHGGTLSAPGAAG